jgi:hypothetical protein
VQHLIALSHIALTHPGDLQLLEDITLTYEWLDNNHEELNEHLIHHHTEPLFLNVENPRADGWQWDAAEHLMFNAPDEDQRRAVRPFLCQYRKLVLAAGAHEMKAPTRPAETISLSAEATLAAWRKANRKLRQEGKFVDIVIETATGKLNAHRMLLVAQSEFFEKMFMGSFSEAQDGRVCAAEYRLEVVSFALGKVQQLLETY